MSTQTTVCGIRNCVSDHSDGDTIHYGPDYEIPTVNGKPLPIATTYDSVTGRTTVWIGSYQVDLDNALEAAAQLRTLVESSFRLPGALGADLAEAGR
jgi:hypothetical protein